MYRYTESGDILRESDGACIPCDPGNRDYRKLMAEGAVIAPYAPYVSPFEGLALAEHDEWLIQQAVSRIRFSVSELAPLGYPDEAPDLAAENEALRAEVETLRKELEARDAPVGLPPNPSDTKLADYYIPAEIRDLMEEGETFPQARKRLSELLNVEKAELRLKRAAGSATEAELKREADVDRLQGLFSKLGEI